MRNLIIAVFVIGVFVIGVFGCQSVHKVKLLQVSAPARITIENIT